MVRHKYQIWSKQEGEQRFDNHTDKLTNYIRFWQADGESEKTSIRTKTALGQLVEAGGFKGGVAPYGYDLVKSGKVNKRKHELFELALNEAEAVVVRIVFDKYVNEGYGAQRIRTSRANAAEAERTVPRNIGGQSLLFENVFAVISVPSMGSIAQQKPPQ